MNRMKISAARLLFFLSLGWILLAGNAGAQQFQASDGGFSTESGRGGVTTLPGGAGYVSVGHTNSVTALPDIYVVHTNLAGGIAGAWVYDFGGTDYAHDIHRCVNGDYVITGVTDISGTADLFILRITAAGGVVWGTVTTNPLADSGFDVLEAANGDIIAAGTIVTNTTGTRDGLIVRVTGPGGLPVAPFPTQYTPAFPFPDVDDYFYGLWEAANGDLIVAGGSNSYGSAYQALVARTNGAGGVIWSTHIGGVNSNEGLNSVIELGIGAQAGNIVGVGSTNANFPDPLDFYVVKLTGGGLLAGPDVSGGNGGGVSDEMFQVRENQIFNAGNLILTGRMNPGPRGGEDGYAVEMTGVWGCPVGKVWSMVYGGTGLDRLYSAHEDPANCIPGYIMCGVTTSPGLVPPGDPAQHYLIKTNNVGVSGCNESRPFDRCIQPNFPQAGAPLVVPSIMQPSTKNPQVLPAPQGVVLCITQCPPPATKGNLSGASDLLEALDAAFPNPVTAGSTFELQYRFSSNDEASIVVSDMAGRIVHNETQQVNAGAGSLTVSTQGWAPGVYAVRVDAGGETRTQRVVVMDK